MTTTEIGNEQAATAALLIQIKFDKQENCLLEQEAIIRDLRAFFAKYREIIAPFDWWNYGWSREVTFNSGQDAKAIALAFGANGWRREHDRHSCGSINWLKTIDGVTLKIDGAESIKPKLIDDVKL